MLDISKEAFPFFVARTPKDQVDVEVLNLFRILAIALFEASRAGVDAPAIGGCQ